VKEVVEKAEVIVFDYLCNPEILRWAPEGTEIITPARRRGSTR